MPGRGPAGFGPAACDSAPPFFVLSITSAAGRISTCLWSSIVDGAGAVRHLSDDRAGAGHRRLCRRRRCDDGRHPRLRPAADVGCGSRPSATSPGAIDREAELSGSDPSGPVPENPPPPSRAFGRRALGVGGSGGGAADRRLARLSRAGRARPDDHDQLSDRGGHRSGPHDDALQGCRARQCHPGRAQPRIQCARSSPQHDPRGRAAAARRQQILGGPAAHRAERHLGAVDSALRAPISACCRARENAGARSFYRRRDPAAPRRAGQRPAPTP